MLCITLLAFKAFLCDFHRWRMMSHLQPQLLEALAGLNRHGLMHCDVKLENALLAELLSSCGGTPRVLLGDMASCRLMDHDGNIPASQ